MDKNVTREQFEGFVKRVILQYSNVFERSKNREEPVGIQECDILQVWFNYTLGNMKALYAIYNSDLYFECTYNKEKAELYIDEYEKLGNIQISFDGEQEAEDVL